jgi:hypothetical protein
MTHLTTWATCFQLSCVQVLWLWHYCLRIQTLLSVIRSLAIAALWQMLDLSSRQPVFVGRVFKMNIQFCCHLCCSSSVISQNNPSQCMTISFHVDFRPLFLFANVVFLRFVYANIILETVTLDTPNKVAVFVMDAPAKCTPTICPLQKLEKSRIFWFFHMGRQSEQSLMHWHKHCRV